MLKNLINSPITRISFGLMLLTVNIVFVSELFGLLPNGANYDLQYRKTIAETLAVQLSLEIGKQNNKSALEVLRTVVQRNDNIQSAALRRNSGEIVVEAGDHEKHWIRQSGDNMPVGQVSIGLISDNITWGAVEIRFNDLGIAGTPLLFGSQMVTLLVFVGLGGFFAYMLFLKRVLRELNPDSVIPDRVRSALDTLSEGLIILDKDDRIIFSNEAFAKKIGASTSELTGKKGSELGWESDGKPLDQSELPWIQTIQGRQPEDAVEINLRTAMNEVYSFQVKVSPIEGPNDSVRGVLATFDNITELKLKNSELNRTLVTLEQVQGEITRQNKELHVLATRDPLTNCLNRRAFFEGFDAMFREAKEGAEELSCIMLDIDHFKSVNDRYGHAVGDEVIKMLADVLNEIARPNDLVGRYGGEEFCIVLPDTDIDTARDIAEHMRAEVQVGRNIKYTSAVPVTSSFGVSNLVSGATNSNEMVDFADQALYVAKESGRNRVVKWPVESARKGDDPVSSAQQSTGDVAGQEPPEEAGSDKINDAVVLTLKQRIHELEQKIIDNPVDKQTGNNSSQQSNFPGTMLVFDRISQSIERALRSKNQFAVVVLDMDSSGRINSTLGYSVGEKLMRLAVERLKKTLRTTDTVGDLSRNDTSFNVSRISSHELVMLLTDIDAIKSVVRVINRITIEMSESFTVEGNEVFTNTSFGVSVFPADGEDPDVLVKNATAAMHEAKQASGNNKFRFYSDEINKRSGKQMQLENDLYRAIKKNEFVLYYQPKVDLVTGDISGMEALIRWPHPKLGLVPPFEFIPLAEDIGLIGKIGDWVLKIACQQVKLWQDANLGEIPIAVNFSPLQFQGKDVVARVLDLIKQAGINPGAIELEVTESIAKDDSDSNAQIMEELKSAGVRWSIDDFGTGYSSLSCLKRFPFHTLKIDRAFVIDLDSKSYDSSLVSAIITIGHNMGFKIVAEGVETEEQLGYLQRLGCDQMQGYYISRPVPRLEATALLVESATIRRKILACANNQNYTQTAGNGNLGPVHEMLGVLNAPPVSTVPRRRAAG